MSGNSEPAKLPSEAARIAYYADQIPRIIDWADEYAAEWNTTAKIYEDLSYAKFLEILQLLNPDFKKQVADQKTPPVFFKLIDEVVDLLCGDKISKNDAVDRVAEILITATADENHNLSERWREYTQKHSVR